MSNTEHPDYPEEYKKWEVVFYGRKFFVDESVLIPRFDTEMLVKKAREAMKIVSFDIIVDIGSWSGIIGTSLSDMAPHTIFIDISKEALAVSEKNFRNNFADKSGEFIHSNLFESFPESKIAGKRVIYVTNLPYIRDGDKENMSADTQFEPSIALFGGPRTGFELYQTFFRSLKEKELLLPGSIVMIEYGFDQREIAEYVLSLFPWKTTFFADYSGVERFALIEG